MTVGHNWVDRFLIRHHACIGTLWSKPLDTQQAKYLNEQAVKDWYQLIKKHIVDAGILPENIYAMDESGFPPSNQGTQRVVSRKGNKVQHKQGGASRENVTALDTICATGEVLQPTVIFKGKNLKKLWLQNNTAKAL